MKLPVQFLTEQHGLPIAEELVHLLNAILASKVPDRKGDRAIAATFNFRDPSYSAEAGGYHPVEIRVQLIPSQEAMTGRLEYITDFCYVGSGPFTELDKEIDFDFSAGECYVLYMERSPLSEVFELYQLWEQNFISYHAMGVFDVTVTLEY